MKEYVQQGKRKSKYKEDEKWKKYSNYPQVH